MGLSDRDRLVDEALLCKAHAKGRSCPSCKRTENIEDNGAQGVHLSFLCVGCGTQWDAQFWKDKCKEVCDRLEAHGYMGTEHG